MAVIRKRGERWYAQLNKQGVRKAKTFDTKSAAKLWATRLEAEIDVGQASGYVSGRDTIGSLIYRYVAEVKPRRPWGRSKDDSLQKLKAGLGTVRASELTAARIIAYAQGRTAGPVTVAAEISYLGGLLRIARAVWRLDVPRDAVADAKEGLRLLGLVGKSRRRERVATDGELDRIKAAWASDAPPEIVDFAVDSAMRLGEIVGLRRADLDGRTILVRDRKHPTEKLGNDQRVPLLGRTLAIIEAQPRAGERIFPYPADTVGTAFRRACARAGVTGLRFHDLRHTGVSRLFRQGYRIEQVALVSGHRDWAMLKRYTHVRAEDVL